MVLAAGPRRASLPLTVLDAGAVAEKARLSDACLALRKTYSKDALQHWSVLAALDGDLSAMIARLRTWADEERPVDAFFDVTADAAD